MNTETKKRVVEAMRTARTNYDSNAKMAVSLEISSAVLSRIFNGEIDGLLTDAKWFSIARRLDVQLRDEPVWITAKTPAYKFIAAQLAACQKNSLSGLLCDVADLGKTHTARCYVKENKYAVYVDCSQVKSKQKLIRQIAKELGLGNTGKYSDVYADLVFYLRSIPNPIIILDEAGDLDYPAFLELKALWNATEGACGWYMMGADGLREKIKRGRDLSKVGFAEIFRRYGSKYQKVTPDGAEAYDEFVKTQIAMVAKANMEAVNVPEMLAKVNGSLTRVKIELNKMR
jgi:DNA transposition AAA+ family ATPase